MIEADADEFSFLSNRLRHYYDESTLIRKIKKETTITISRKFAAKSEIKAKKIRKRSWKITSNSNYKLKNSGLININFNVNETLIETENVIGLVEGTDKSNETIAISAHYDHEGIKDGEIFNGADDDGSAMQR